MKEYIRKRVLEICAHILETKHTVRQAANVFGVSKSTVHKDNIKQNDKKEFSTYSWEFFFIIVGVKYKAEQSADKNKQGIFY